MSRIDMLFQSALETLCWSETISIPSAKEMTSQGDLDSIADFRARAEAEGYIDGENFEGIEVETGAPRDEFREECEAFLAEVDEAFPENDFDAGQMGHDFLLTRNGHGAGFWDGDWGDDGDELTRIAKGYGNISLYLGDDMIAHFAG